MRLTILINSPSPFNRYGDGAFHDASAAAGGVRRFTLSKRQADTVIITAKAPSNSTTSES